MPTATAPKTETREVPVEAARLSIGEFQLGDNGEDAKTAPLKMLARTGQPISHWYWGRLVHDLDGMRLSKSRVAVDYCHNDHEIIGYLNHFDTSGGNLEASGALVPYAKADDLATEIIHKARLGVPYEASIDFRGAIRIEELDAGTSAEVNGYTLEGPACIIREWPLRGVAVCPHGGDPNTESALSEKGDKLTIHVTKKESTMSQDATVKADQAVETELTEAPEANAQQSDQAVEGATATEQTEPTDGQRFLSEFGDRGGVWFAEGKTFEEAAQLHRQESQGEINRLAKENEQLRQQLAAADRGGEKPVELRPEDNSGKPKSLTDVVTKTNSRQAA